MARADLLCDIIKYGLNNDNVNFRKAAEAICAEERSNQHNVLAKKNATANRNGYAVTKLDARALISGI